MKVIVVSDTHGSFNPMSSVFLRNPDADLFIHLGDGERDVDAFILEFPEYRSRVIHVCGNCDFSSLSHGFEVIPAGDHKIFATHGHTYGVKGGLDNLKRNAKMFGCDIVLYGHTHIRYNKFEDGMYILNPGSVGNPHDGNVPSFGHIDITPGGVVVNIADV